MNRISDKVVSVMKKLLDIYSFHYKLQLDKGNVVAAVNLSFKALGKKMKLGFRTEINMGKVAKRIFKSSMQFFKNFVKNIKKLAKGKFKEVLNSAKRAVGKLINTLKNGCKNAAKAV